MTSPISLLVSKKHGIGYNCNEFSFLPYVISCSSPNWTKSGSFSPIRLETSATCSGASCSSAVTERTAPQFLTAQAGGVFLWLVRTRTSRATSPSRFTVALEMVEPRVYNTHADLHWSLSMFFSTRIPVLYGVSGHAPAPGAQGLCPVTIPRFGNASSRGLYGVAGDDSGLIG